MAWQDQQLKASRRLRDMKPLNWPSWHSWPSWTIKTLNCVPEWWVEQRQKILWWGDVKGGLAAKGHISVQTALRQCNLRRIAIPGRPKPWLVESWRRTMEFTWKIGDVWFHSWRHPKNVTFGGSVLHFFSHFRGPDLGFCRDRDTFSHGRCINIRTGGPLETGWISPVKATAYQYPTYQNNLRCLTQKITKSTNIHHFQVPSIPKKWWFHHFQRNGAL